MNPEDYTVRKHKPVVRSPGASRARRAQVALIALAAFLIGGVGGFVYLRLPALERAPDQAAVDAATPIATPAATEAASEIVTAVATEAASAATTEIAASVLRENLAAATPQIAASTYRSSGAAQADALAARPPTATSTPVPPVESVEGVIGVGGADLWDAESGGLLAHLAQGDAVTVRERSADGEWLRLETGPRELPGIDGWAKTEDVIVFDPSRLVVRDVVIMPITPTPTLGATAVVVAAASTSSATSGESSAGNASVARRTPVAGDGPIARVLLEDARLNIRSGPGASYRVIAKALADETFTILGRDESGRWLQLAITDVEGGFGWAALEFLESSVAVRTLPVVATISPAPAYQGETGPAIGPETGHTETQKSAQIAAMSPPASVTAPRGLPTGRLLLQQTWGGAIFIYDLETGTLRLLTGGFDPSFSPDGQTVAFTRGGGENGLYLIDSDGSDERLIFNGRELLRSPKWSPDGQWIVFERGDEFVRCRQTGSRCTDPDTTSDDFPLTVERQQRLARVDTNGQNYRDLAVLQRAQVPDWNEAGIVYQSPAGIQITKDEPDFATSQLVFFQIRKQYEMDPDWQPGGGRIVFHRREASHWEIFSVNPDGTGLTALTMPSFTLVPELPSNVAPAWSPDGTHIVFLSNRTPELSAGSWHVWVMDADGGNQRMLPVELEFTYTFVSEQMIDWGR